MYEFADKSGVPLPEELRQDMLNEMTNPVGGVIRALMKKWDFVEKHR